MKIQVCIIVIILLYLFNLPVCYWYLFYISNTTYIAYNLSKDSLLDLTPENVDCLLKNLDEQYITVERAISLRSANVETVIEMRNCVNQTFLDLLKLMQSANVDVSHIESATKNKQEFDTHVNNWIKSVAATPSFTNAPQN